jgi:hypothetical protein
MLLFTNRSMKNSLLGFLVLLAACGGSGINGEDSATPTLEQPVKQTASPTPAPDLVYLIRGGVAAERVEARVEESITALAVAAGNKLVVLTELSDGDLEENVKVVFYLPPDKGLNDLAARYPAVQFVAIGIHGLSEASNLTRIGPGGLREDQVGFVAGVIAAAVTPDWRVGAISVQGSSEDRASNLAFQNGAIFYCGLCRPAYPPFNSYPAGAETSSVDSLAIQGAMEALTTLDVDTVFLSPELSAVISVERLEGPGVSYLGGETPGENLGARWIATVRAAPELAIAEIWDRIRMGDSGETVSMPIIIEDVNPERLTPGKEAWVQEILQDLSDGYIDTGVDPLTGIAR